MKKLILAVAIIASGLSTSALTVNPSHNIVSIVSTSEDFKEIAIENLPIAVKAALARDFSSAKIGKAYVNNKEQYKIEIYMQPTDDIVFADKNGHWLKRADIEEAQGINNSI